MQKNRLCSLLFVILCVACGGEGTAPIDDRPRPGLRILRGDGVSDTVETIPAQALSVQVADVNGQPLAGVIVRFSTETVVDAAPYPVSRPTMYLANLSSSMWVAFVTATTDANGKASVLVRLGMVAGTGRVLVNAPSVGLVDTAQFTIKPGAASRISLSPRDTALFAGGQSTLRVSVFDRLGNVRPDVPTLSATSDRISFSGGVVSGLATGRAMVLARVGSFRDSMFVSVVPRGTIAAYTAMRSTGDQLAVFTFDLDGSHFKKLATSVIGGGYFGEMPSVWSADGRSVIYHDNKYDHTKMLYVVDATSGASRRLIIPSLQLADERFPTRSADGQWLYYNGPDYGVSQAYRVSADGAYRELLSPVGRTQSYPDPSPDGQRLVYTSSGRLEIMNIATRAITQLNIGAVVARWLPQGDIVYSDAGPGFWIVKVDGTGARQVAGGSQFATFFGVSPDGKYVVASKAAQITIVDLSTGEEMPIAVTATSHGFVAPSWKP